MKTAFQVRKQTRLVPDQWLLVDTFTCLVDAATYAELYNRLLSGLGTTYRVFALDVPAAA